MTDLEPTAPAADTWEAILEGWRRRYPGQRDSVLFCIHKLQQNPELTLRDFRDEARLHGIPVAGRSLHSARVMLGLAKGAVSAASTAAMDAPEADVASTPRRRQRAADGEMASIEDQVVTAMRRIQSAAGAESERMRAGIRQAIAILQRALGE